MATREYQFIVGPETSTLPTIGEPLGNTFTNSTTADLTIVAGATHWHPNLTLTSGVDYVVNSGGMFLGAIQVALESGSTFTVNSGGQGVLLD